MNTKIECYLFNTNELFCFVDYSTGTEIRLMDVQTVIISERM